jgi:hypothetical protein
MTRDRLARAQTLGSILGPRPRLGDLLRVYVHLLIGARLRTNRRSRCEQPNSRAFIKCKSGAFMVQSLRHGWKANEAN